MLDYIPKLVKASGVCAGEKVLIHFWGDDGEKNIANIFLSAAAALGATPVLLQQSRTVNRAVFQNAKDHCFDDSYFDSLSHFDAVLDVFAYRPIVLGSELEPEQMALYRRYISKLFYALMKAKRFTQIRIPTQANAAESGLDPNDYIERMEAAYNIDYDMLHTACLQQKELLGRSRRYTLHTGENCMLHFDLTDRCWNVDAGDGDLPCGEVYIAPIEEYTNGAVYFDTLYLEDIGSFQGVTLIVQNGRLTGADQSAVADFIQTLSPADSVICELGLGMNPNVSGLCGYTILDEKMAGTFHIAIGANHMFGGQNEAKQHIDLVGAGSFQLIPTP